MDPQAPQAMSRWSIMLTTFGGMTLISGPIAAGMMGRSPGAIVLFAVGMVIAKVISGRQLWSQMAANRGPGILAPMISATVFVQTILVAVLFGLGWGVGALVGYARPAAEVQRFDLALASMLVLIGITAGEFARGRDWP